MKLPLLTFLSTTTAVIAWSRGTIFQEEERRNNRFRGLQMGSGMQETYASSSSSAAAAGIPPPPPGPPGPGGMPPPPSVGNSGPVSSSSSAFSATISPAVLSSCQIIPVTFYRSDVEAGFTKNELGNILNQVPFYSTSTNQLLGTYSDVAVNVSSAGAGGAMNQTSECTVVGAFSFLPTDNATQPLYRSQITMQYVSTRFLRLFRRLGGWLDCLLGNLLRNDAQHAVLSFLLTFSLTHRFTCKSELNSITGGSGVYGCAKGFEHFVYIGTTYLNSQLNICHELCPYQYHS